MLANFLAMVHVLLRNFLRSRKHQVLPFIHGPSLTARREDLFHRVHGIHCRWSGLFEGLINFLDMVSKGRKTAAAKSARTLGQAVRGRRPDSARAPHYHVAAG